MHARTASRFEYAPTPAILGFTQDFHSEYSIYISLLFFSFEFSPCFLSSALDLNPAGIKEQAWVCLDCVYLSKYICLHHHYNFQRTFLSSQLPFYLTYITSQKSATVKIFQIIYNPNACNKPFSCPAGKERKKNSNKKEMDPSF